MREHPVEPYVVGLLDQVADEFTNAVMYAEDLRHTIDMLRDNNAKLKEQVWKLEKELDNFYFEKEKQNAN